MICACWNGTSSLRPSFAEISNKLQSLINDEQQRQHLKFLKRGSGLDFEQSLSDDTGQSSGKEEVNAKIPRKSLLDGSELMPEYNSDIMVSASSILREIPIVLKV